MQQQIEREILSKLSKEINDFQIALQKMSKQPITVQVLANLLIRHTSLTFEQKQKLAIGINFLVEYHFKSYDKNPQLWNYYCNTLLICPKQQLQWKIAKILQKSLILFMQSFEDQFNQIMSNIYTKMNTYHTIMCMNCVIHGQLQTKNRLNFFKSISRDYVLLGLDIIQQVNKLNPYNNQKQMLKILADYCTQYLLSLKQAIIFLRTNASPDSQWQYLFTMLSSNTNFMQVIIGFLRIDDEHRKWFNDGESMRNQTYNIVKAVALQCYVEILNRYNTKIPFEQINNFSVLRFLEKELPQAVQQMSKIPPQVLLLDCNSMLCGAILKFIEKGSQFLLMNNYFWQNGKYIFWKIIVPLLQLNDQQIRQYHNQPQNFVALALNMVGLDEQTQQIQCMHNNCKLIASGLLDRMSYNIDGLLTYIVKQVTEILKYKVHGQDKLTQEAEKYSVKINLQNCFTILTILSGRVFLREDLLRMIEQTMNDQHKNLLHLVEIDKARYLIFLKYYFEVLDTLRREEQYFMMAADCLKQKQCLVKCAIQFFKDYKSMNEAYIIWNRLLELSSSTDSKEIFQILSELIKNNIEQMPINDIMQILKTVMRRVQKQYNEDIRKQEERTQNNIQLPNRQCVLQCFKILLNIVKNAHSKQNCQQIYGQIWPLFDMMENFKIIQYGDQIIKVFNVILQAKQNIGEEFFQFINFFNQYHCKDKQIGKLYQTYMLLFNKGKEFLKSSQGQQNFKKIINNILCVIDFRIKQTVCEPLNLLQYAILKFPDYINHKYVFEQTRNNLFNFSPPLQDYQLCHFLNLWWIGSVYSLEYDFQKLLDEPVDLYEGYNGRVLACSIRMNIAEQCYAKNISMIIKILQYGVRLLDRYLRFPAPKKQNRSKMLHQFKKQKPQQQIKECFRLCRQMLSKQDYDHVLNEVSHEAPITTIKQLLNQCVIRSEPRKILKIAHRV